MPKVPSKEALRKLEEIFSILVDPEKIFDDDDPKYFGAPIAASLALQTVSGIADQIHDSPALSALVSSNSGILMAWARYFYQTELLYDHSCPLLGNDDNKQKWIKKLSSTILAISYTYPDKKEHHPLVRSNYELISYLWLEEDTRNPFSSDAPASVALWNILHRTCKVSPELMQALLSSANGDADYVSDLAITRLRKAMKENLDDRKLILIHLCNAIMLSLGRNHEISLSMHRHQIFTTFSKCLRLLSRRSNKLQSAGCLFNTASSLYYTGFFRMIVKDAENGTRALRQCIQYGLLDGIAQLLVEIRLGRALDDTLAAGLIKTFALLHMGLIIESVCNSISKAFKILPLAVYETHPRDSVEWALWKRLIDAVMVQCVFVKLQNIICRDEKLGGSCEHCKRDFPRRALRRCKRCRLTKYCSIICQADDWRKKHKITCSLWKDWNTMISSGGGASCGTKDFAVQKALYDIRRHRPHLQSLAAQKYPYVHPDLVGFVVDYCRDPPSIGTFLVQDIGQEYSLLASTFITRTLCRNPKSSEREAVIKVEYQHVVGQRVHNIFIDVFEEGGQDEYPHVPFETQGVKKRPSCQFADSEIPLEAWYDEIDEIFHRMETKASMFPELKQDPSALVDLVCDDIAFDLGYPLKNLFIPRSESVLNQFR